MAYEVQHLIKPISRTRSAGFVTSHICNPNTWEGEGRGQKCDVILIYLVSLRAAPKQTKQTKNPHTLKQSSCVERKLQRHSQGQILKYTVLKLMKVYGWIPRAFNRHVSSSHENDLRWNCAWCDPASVSPINVSTIQGRLNSGRAKSTVLENF